ncbi:MAG: V-type ATPase 116kDa subunit family protein [Thiohalophilus sp.]|jgi:V/A-type H+-transporting ATPase subunit I
MITLRPERMRHVTVYLLQDEVPDISLKLARFGWFNPITPSIKNSRLRISPDSEFRDLYMRARKRYDKVTHFLGHPLHAEETAANNMVSRDTLFETDKKLGELWQRCSSLEEKQRKIADEKRHISQLYSTLQRYKKLNINLDRLHRPHSFLDIRLGTAPLSEVTKLRDALSLNQYTLTLFERQENLAHIVIAGDKEQAGNVEKVLNAASFRVTQLPDEFHDYPERLESQITSRLSDLNIQQEKLDELVIQYANDNEEFLQKARDYLNIAAAYADLSTQLEREGALTAIEGWVPRKQIDKFRHILTHNLGTKFVLQIRRPEVEERYKVPSYSDYSGLLRPFAGLVRNYGVPRYGEFDPTWLFSISYILMFGMMFGDIGQGAVIMMAGILLQRKLPDYWIFLVSIGISSILFGFVYGSLFGFEEVIHPLWISPLSDPIRMLTVALGWGIGFIVLMVLLSIHNYWIEGDTEKAILSGRGLAGLLLYLSLIALIWRWYQSGDFSLALFVLFLVSLILIMVHSWRSIESPRGERTLVVFIETFEAIMGYFSNTLSFLRVAAFSLNHVALIVAVFAVASMFDKTGEWITVVLGNLFVLVLEGAIVAIQVLRLEYYEGFSRFYRGDGIAFKPLTTGDAV